ncbi:MAG: PP0621 family protein [Thioalkalispiraceae bacterium]
MGIIVLIRLIIFFLIGWLAFRLVRNWLNRKPGIEKAAEKEIDTMVRCQVCDVHLPRQRAIEHNGRFFCSQEHKDQYDNQPQA